MLYKICVLVIFHIFYVNQIDAFADNTTECASPAFKGNSASPDIYSTVYTCIANITDALMPPRLAIFNLFLFCGYLCFVTAPLCYVVICT